MTLTDFTPDIPVTDGILLPDLILDPARRHDFMLVFEVNNANPNGDPDTDNMPRTEPDQGRGLATDTSIKRKVRDIAAMLGYPIFIQPSQTLNRSISEAFAAVGAPVPQTNLTEDELENEELMEHLAGLETFTLKVLVPVTSLCPCSKEISARGAHNQRSHVTVAARINTFVWIEEIIDRVEQQASCELWGLLKRPDEKYVTEHAYDNPKFVEDLVRDIAASLNRDARIEGYVVEAENFESIHNHSAYAMIEKGPGPDSGA